MGAYNGRFMARSIFGLPLPAVILAGISFCCLIMLLFPASGLHPFRPILLIAFVGTLLRARSIIRLGALLVIIKILSKEKALQSAKKLSD